MTTRPLSAMLTRARPTSPGCCSWHLLSFIPTIGSSFHALCSRACLARVQGLAVRNVFGERLWIEAADQGAEGVEMERYATVSLETLRCEVRPGNLEMTNHVNSKVRAIHSTIQASWYPVRRSRLRRVRSDQALASLPRPFHWAAALFPAGLTPTTSYP